MQAYRVETTVELDGSLTVHDLPFLKGEKVEVIVLPSLPKETQLLTQIEAHPLRQMRAVYRQDPFAPAAPEKDWEALR